MRKSNLVIIVHGLLLAASAAGQRLTLITDKELAAPARHGLSKLEDALRAKGLTVERTTSTAKPAGEFVVLAGLSRGGGPAPRQLQSPPSGAEALVVKRTDFQGKPAVILCGSDARGLMYAALDAAERIGWAENPGAPFAHIRDTSEKPFLSERAISIYTMQRAYFESRLYDEAYWKRHFDVLAASRINGFVIIFGYENGGFLAPAYPYFFDVPGFPDVKMVGLTREQQERNTAAFRALIRIAHERGIAVIPAPWDHIYRGGVQGGGIAGASELAGKPTPGLVWGVTTENVAAYNKAAISKFLDVFPDVDALQFRMHAESGLKPSEMEGFWHEVFTMMRQKKPGMLLDLRAKELPDSIINDAIRQGLKVRVSTKHWMEQMGLPFHPTHVNRQNQHDRRHGYADLLRYPQIYKVHWQLWSGGTTRLLLWADPAYVRRFAGQAHVYDGDSFEVNEMLATKMLGEPHTAEPRPIHQARYRHYDYEFERYWHFYQLWGRVSYNPETSPEIWEREFQRRFGKTAGLHVMRGLHIASQVLPRIVAASYRYQLFPTTRGWAEAMRQGPLAQYADMQGSDIQQFINPRDEVKRALNGEDTAMRRPQQTSEWFSQIAERILAEAAQAESSADVRKGNELVTTLTDLRILAWLARFHAARLPAAVHYNLYRETGDPLALDDAIASEKQAVAAWERIAESAGDVYSEDLAFGVHRVGFPRHWKEELERLRKDQESLLAEKEQAKGRAQSDASSRARAMLRRTSADGEPPAVKLEAAGKAKPGMDYVVSARIEDASGVKTVSLRYRHMTQYEDYETADMKRDEKTGRFTAAIPAGFIDPKWDLMYFVEAIDTQGNGRMYPDLEVETPYVVVPVAR